ncbi:unnamed protein product [Prunus armeniaca]
MAEQGDNKFYKAEKFKNSLQNNFVMERKVIDHCLQISCNVLINHNLIETLISSNYKKWRDDLEIALGLLDYEMVLEEDAPMVPAANASAETKSKYAKWTKGNKMAILIMKRSISPSVKGSITTPEKAKELLKSIGEFFLESKKV